MQLRVAGLIERCQDEIVLESTLVINDDLNTLFVRYERWLRNSAAAKSIAAEREAGQAPPTTVADSRPVSLVVCVDDLHTYISCYGISK